MALFVFYPAVLAETKPSDTPEKATSENPEDTLQITENWEVAWPEDNEWTSNYVHTTAKSKMEIYYPAGQTPGSWKEMLTVEALYSPKKNVIGLARQIYLGTVRGSPDATWDILTKGTTEQGYAFVTFEIICPDFLSGEPPQVQLWKLIIGRTGLFTLQYSYHGEKLPPERKEQILAIFDNSYIKTEEKQE
jgi:hypothetical protein